MSYSTRRPSAVGQYLSMTPPLKMAGNLQRNNNKKDYKAFENVYLKKKFL